ncbi:MAG: hypothetical protein P9M03_09995 [Candidatus Theseobacter exili]|nr:hypothetical protein [Candidatus Theseobacter exili]
MKKHLIVLSILFFSSNVCAKENTVHIGENYQKEQRSIYSLNYRIPAGWELNKDEAKKIGIEAVLLPKGISLSNTNKVITIAFQKKDLEMTGLRTLQEFFKVDMTNTLNMFPDLESQGWQPSNLNPDKIFFMSIQINKHKESEPSPSRVLFIDSGDGYYSITLTVSSLAELDEKVYSMFFNSISLKNKPFTKS